MEVKKKLWKVLTLYDVNGKINAFKNFYIGSRTYVRVNGVMKVILYK